MAISLDNAAALRTGTTNTKAEEPETVKTEVLGDDRYTHPTYGSSAINVKLIRRTLADGTLRFDMVGLTPLQFADMMINSFGPQAERLINKAEIAKMFSEADLSEFTNNEAN